MYEMDYSANAVCHSYEDVNFLRRYAYEIALSYGENLFEEEENESREQRGLLPSEGARAIIKTK